MTIRYPLKSLRRWILCITLRGLSESYKLDRCNNFRADTTARDLLCFQCTIFFSISVIISILSLDGCRASALFSSIGCIAVVVSSNGCPLTDGLPFDLKKRLDGCRASALFSSIGCIAVVVSSNGCSLVAGSLFGLKEWH